jgi:hypothetical protein
MSRALRISLIALGSIVLVLGLLVLYIDSELKPEPLGKRVAVLLAEAKIKGGITKVQAALDGTFSAEGVDLTLENGTQIKVAALDGKINVTFRGLIACGRTISRDDGVATLICIGVGNREYIDLVIPEVKRNDLFNWAVLEGKGVQTKAGTIEVSKIKGIAIINVESQTSR